MKIFITFALFTIFFGVQGAVIEWMQIKPSNLVNTKEDIVSHRWTAKNYWETFKQGFKKVYSSLEEEAHRFEVFAENVQLIEKHNQHWAAGRKAYKLKVNEFADLSRKEINGILNGFRRSYNYSLPKKSQKFVSSSGAKLPTAINWNEKGAVTPVKNQGQCGSCWAFSTTGSLEGQHYLKTGKLVSLSEQQLVDCSKKFGNNGCNGGLMDQGFSYVKANKGLDTEKSYPYEAENDKCRFKPDNVGATDKGYTDVAQGDEDALKEAVGKIGPISVAIDASRSSFHFYDQGVYDEPKCSTTELDHGVLAVGYGIDEESGQAYWMVKNSWGPTWGLKGFIKMSRNKNNQCGIATSASYPLV